MNPALLSGGLIASFLLVMYGCWCIYDFIKIRKKKKKEDDK